ncbi:hypothetical protein KUTeg_016529 [Tegillarca granosa]|uniref:Sulfotransferase n=1 Tax=Tegillarca granosa TaxID=220873 RepID=A0ABQ9EM27_TEGGR|nr:hypothetical protein KUTeg_016529 [Tegillarca granosa]
MTCHAKNKKEALQHLDNLFNCNLLSIPEFFWRDKFQSYSRKGKFYRNCVKEKSSNVTECLLELQKICLNSKFILIKATRIYMETVEPLIERYKDLTVIHLTRDPRGLIFSRLFYKFYVTESTVQKFANNHCSVLLKNIRDSETFVKKYPMQVMQLRYETLACDPLNISKRLYEFCGLTFSSKISNTISSMTMEGQLQRGVMGLKKPNSCEAAYAWKKNITNEVSTKIEKECVPLFQKMHLQNMTYNVRSA